MSVRVGFRTVRVLPRAQPAPPALNPARGSALPFNHKYREDVRVLAPGGYSIVASEVSLSQRTGGSLSLFAASNVVTGND